MSEHDVINNPASNISESENFIESGFDETSELLIHCQSLNRLHQDRRASRRGQPIELIS
jgi:hypothetical protein